MAKVYSAPSEIGPVPSLSAFKGDIRTGIKDYQTRSDEWRDRLIAWAKANGKGLLKGRIVRIPWADSYAEYIVLSGTKLIHVPLSDGWDVPEYMTRGLKARDINNLSTKE